MKLYAGIDMCLLYRFPNAVVYALTHIFKIIGTNRSISLKTHVFDRFIIINNK